VALLNDRLALNGSLYLFASPQMAGRVEVSVREVMNVLAVITWNKGARRKGAAGSGVDVTGLRTFWQASSERIIFAEHFSEPYEAAFQEAKKRIFGDYMRAAFDAAGVTRTEINKLFPSRTGGLVNCVANWLLGFNCPTEQQYQRIRQHIGDHYLTTPHSLLMQQVAEEQAGLEGLRRPFNLDDKLQWGDVWDFDPPSPTPGKHPCEKPLALLQHIIQVSTKPRQTVLDAFMGSGATGEAALRMGRSFIGIERDEHWFARACKRVEDAQRQGDFFVEAAA
jgi:adenine-specific DNA-methyltransferase